MSLMIVAGPPGLMRLMERWDEMRCLSFLLWLDPGSPCGMLLGPTLHCSFIVTSLLPGCSFC